MEKEFKIPQAKLDAADLILSSEFRTPMAQASYSRLDYYHNCPLAFKHKYVDKKVPLDAPVMKDRQGNVKPPAWLRGSRIHQAMDDFINGKTDALIPELYDLRFEIDAARILKAEHPDRVLTEQNKFFDLDYKLIDLDSLPEDQRSTTSGGDPCPLNYHVLVIIDLLIFDEDFKHATIIDLKSGKEHAVKHGSQTQLYALFTALEYPQLETLTTQLWYCDKAGMIRSRDFTNEAIMKYFNYWNRRIGTMHKDLIYRPNPHESNCFFCAWGKKEHSNKWLNKDGTCTLSLDKRDRV